jgi:hypothetical protein
MKKKSVVTIDPKIMSGTPCFAGTRVPLMIAFKLIRYYQNGASVKEKASPLLAAVRRPEWGREPDHKAGRSCPQMTFLSLGHNAV